MQTNKIEEIPLRDYSHTEAIAKLIPAVNELCRRVNAIGESTHSEPESTQPNDEEIEKIIGNFIFLFSRENMSSREKRPDWFFPENLTPKEVAEWLRSTLLSFGKQQREAGEKARYRKGVYEPKGAAECTSCDDKGWHPEYKNDILWNCCIHCNLGRELYLLHKFGVEIKKSIK